MKSTKKGIAGVLLLFLVFSGCYISEKGLLEMNTTGKRAPGLGRSPWQMHQGEGVVAFGYTTSSHGAPVEYSFSTIPPAEDPGWGPAPDGDVIGYSISSTLCGVVGCRQGGEFTYFQTFVTIPEEVVVTEFTIAFAGIDDGVMVTVFNSTYPGGLVIDGSYVYLGGSGTTNLADYVVSGEANRVVVTHVDDCCSVSTLQMARVVLNGEVVIVNQPPVADAGNDQELLTSASLTSVQLDGTGSYDPDLDPLTYSWSLEGIEFSTDSTPVIDLAPGIYTISLVVFDGKEYSLADEVIISIEEENLVELTLTPPQVTREKPNKKVKATLILPFPEYYQEFVDRDYRMVITIGGKELEAIWESKVIFGKLTNYKAVKIAGYFYTTDILAITTGYGNFEVEARAGLVDGTIIKGRQELTILEYRK